MYKEKFALRLRELCQEKTIYRVAKECKINSQTLYKYIHCQCDITLEKLWILADYFGVPIDYLAGRTDY